MTEGASRGPVERAGGHRLRLVLGHLDGDRPYFRRDAKRGTQVLAFLTLARTALRRQHHVMCVNLTTAVGTQR